MDNFWDAKFNTEELIYGSEPNAFFKATIDSMKPGSLLLPGEGEGRNAIYAAKQGWTVTAHDGSKVAKEKAMRMAEIHGVNINYIVSDILDLKPSQVYDVIGLIYIHLPNSIRRLAHHNIIKYLKPTGTLFLEMFSKKQIERNTGGPKNIDMLYSIEELINDFKSIKIVSVEETVTTLQEGHHHNGEADVIRLIARK